MCIRDRSWEEAYLGRQKAVAAVQMSTKGRMEKHALVQPGNGIPHSNTKEHTTKCVTLHYKGAATCGSVDRTQMHCAELKKLHTREYVLHGSIYIKL